MKSKRVIPVLKFKKCFFFEKIDKNVQFHYLFLGIPKIFLYVRVSQVAFLSEDLKKVACLKQYPLYGFRFRDVRQGSIQKTDEIRRVCAPKRVCAPLQSMTDFYRSHCTLSHYSLQKLQSKLQNTITVQRIKYLSICFTVSMI